MCSTVFYIYTCRHRERVIFRCNRLPDNAPPAVVETCVRREAMINGHWTTRLDEFCHDCEQASRQARRQRRRQPRAPVPSRAHSADPDTSRTGAAWTRPATVKDESREEHEARNRLIDAMVEQLIEDVDNQRAQAHDFRANDDPWMAFIPQRRPEGIIRPLESNHLENIGRAEGRLQGLTPTQIWRFLP